MNMHIIRIVFFCFFLILFLLLSACSGGGGSNSNSTTNIVYREDQDTDDVIELYQVSITSPGMSTKLNSALVTGGDITSIFKNQ